jgi:tripartite-type tricarboxylate transporter receptor subunit TctC
MKLSRRSLLAAAAGAAASPVLSGTAAAQAYPARPITIVVPFAAGGALDVISRILAERMRQSLGQPVVVENVPGAGGSIAVGRVARAEPDGHTLVSGHWGTHVVNGASYDLAYDLRTAFEPIALTAFGRQLIAARKSMPANDLLEFVAWAKAKPDKVLFGTTGAGAGQVNAFFFQRMTGAQIQFVSYRGLAQVTQDLVGGQIDMMISSAADLLPQARAGTIKVYAVAAQRRLQAAPDIPTVDEAGLPGFHTQMWNALWAPARTPSDIVARLNAAVVDTLADQTVRSRLAQLGQELPTREEQTPQALAAHHQAEIEKWWPIVKAAGIKPE